MIAHCFIVNDAFEDVPHRGDKALCGWELPGYFHDAALSDPKCPRCLADLRKLSELSEHKWHKAN